MHIKNKNILSGVLEPDLVFKRHNVQMQLTLGIDFKTYKKLNKVNLQQEDR